MQTPAKILIVDDEEVVRRSYARILEGTNCKVKAAWTWMQVSQLMQSDPYDLVLLDLRMPDMDGMKILKAIRQSWPESEVIIITGYPTLETAKEALTLGAYDYLTKPVGPDQILDAANGAIQHKMWALHTEPDEPECETNRIQSAEVPGNIAESPAVIRRAS
ncbi:MAG TPA: response regulator [Albitalea sp.]